MPLDSPMDDPTFSLIEQAVEVLRGVANVTPVISNRTLDGLAHARVFLKCENFQRVGAFKFRGAYHAVARHMAANPARTFATISSGNHAQGIALACQLLGAAAHVVMPKPYSSMNRITSYNVCYTKLLRDRGKRKGRDPLRNPALP